MARPKKRGRDVSGVILLDKPRGISSNDLLQKVKRLFNANRAGHTGALDPLATGMLPICLGEATKFSQFLLDSDKCYQVTAKLGERTNTSDADGLVISTKEIQCNQDTILAALPHFCGNLKQIPTMFSALKYQGKPLYEYARAGINIKREARPITIFDLQFIDYQTPYLTLQIHCSKGTYIRTLIDDLGEYLGCGAHVSILRRTAVAAYDYQQMITLEKLEQIAQQGLEHLDKQLLPIDSSVARLPALTLNKEQSQRIQQGQRLRLTNMMETQNGQVRLFDPNAIFLGIGEIDHNILRPRRMII